MCKARIPVNVNECPLCGTTLDNQNGTAKNGHDIINVDAMTEIEILHVPPFVWKDLSGSDALLGAGGNNACAFIKKKDDKYIIIMYKNNKRYQQSIARDRTGAMNVANTFLRINETDAGIQLHRKQLCEIIPDKHLERFRIEVERRNYTFVEHEWNIYTATLWMKYQTNEVLDK
jgi:hypothetical protein